MDVSVYMWRQQPCNVGMHCVGMHESIVRTHGGLGFYCFFFKSFHPFVYFTPFVDCLQSLRCLET